MPGQNQAEDADLLHHQRHRPRTKPCHGKRRVDIMPYDLMAAERKAAVGEGAG